MRVEDLVLVSIDDHVIEPRDMFDGHVPERLRDQAPKSVIDEHGVEKWWFQGVASVSGSLNAVVGWPKEEWGMDPTTFAEMRPGAYDIHERVRDMNHNGILASMCFPSFAGFSARFFQEAADRELALLMLQAYNDWHIDEWAAACYVTDPTALRVRDDIGIDIIAWECDYPHSDSIFPRAPEFVLAEMQHAGVPDEEINQITWQNSCRFFGWDPFRHQSAQQATVGALRSLSPDVDTTIRSKHEWRERYQLASS